MRRIFFYLKMAGGNILRNRRFYLPYLLCCAGTAAMSYIVGYLCMDRMVDEMPGADYVRTFMWLGVYVMVFFSFFIIRFANSFIIKRRRRELGLYNILGLQKGNIAVLMAFETAILLIVSLIFGLGIGILFSKLALLILAQVLSFGVPMGFSISGGAIVLTAGMLAADYLFCLVSNIWGVAKSSPVELLHSSNEGEREPKSRWLLAIFGILCLGGGYTIAVTTQNPLDALLLFLIAVILVIIGTYCLFTAVSVAVLKLLRKKKSFYYKPGPFTAVSGLLFRMKQNAVGMANICILATMVLVTISTTVSLYTGIGDVVYTQYPYEIQAELALNNYFDDSFHPAAEGDDRLVYDAAHNALVEGGYGIEKEDQFHSVTFTVAETAKGVYTCDRSVGGDFYLTAMGFTTLEDYNALTGENKTLAPGEVLSYASTGQTYTDVTVDSLSFTVKENLSDFPISTWDATEVMLNAHFLVVDSMDTLEQVFEMQAETYANGSSPLRYTLGIEVAGDADDKMAAYSAVTRSFEGLIEEDGVSLYVMGRQTNLTDITQMYGSFLFLGILLGGAFMMAAVLIIYYKQVSEGYDDRGRFEIMEKVGMDAKLVRKTIRTQVLLVFFLPLLTAGVHILFAFPMIARLLTLFSLSNISLFGVCTAVTLILFAVIYTIVYLLTARTYYKIVQSKG